MTTEPYLNELRECVLHPTNAIVGLVDDVLKLCRLHRLQINWRDNRCRVKPIAEDIEEVLEFPLRTSVFRAILARIATLCDEQNPGTFSPYGGNGILVDGTDVTTKLEASWVNTTGEQRLTIVPVAKSTPLSAGSPQHQANTTSLTDQSAVQKT